MGRHGRSRSNSREKVHDDKIKAHHSRDYRRDREHKSRSRSPPRNKHQHNSKWDSPDHNDRRRGNDRGRHEGSGRRYEDNDRRRRRGDDYESERERNQERKAKYMNRRRRDNDDDDGNFEWGKRDDRDGKKDKDDNQEKQKPNFGLSGKLAEDTNKVNGTVIKYAEPPEARIPKRRWRLYPFKGEKSLPTLYIHRQSAYLIGRERKLVDLPVDHPSCSKQHAVLQYRLVPYERDDGTQGKRVLPYIIDLGSANGTFLNNKQIDGQRYYELMEKDVLKFGFSTREYVLLHEGSKDEDDYDVNGDEIKKEPKSEPRVEPTDA